MDSRWTSIVSRKISLIDLKGKIAHFSLRIFLWNVFNSVDFSCHGLTKSSSTCQSICEFQAPLVLVVPICGGSRVSEGRRTLRLLQCSDVCCCHVFDLFESGMEHV